MVGFSATFRFGRKAWTGWGTFSIQALGSRGAHDQRFRNALGRTANVST